MKNQALKLKNLNQRKRRVRSRISGTGKTPRLSVFRSLNHTYAQLIDDENSKTLAMAKDSEVKLDKGVKQQRRVKAAHAIGSLLGERAKKLGISQAVFDRGGRRFHGIIKAVADGARETGLKF